MVVVCGPTNPVRVKPAGENIAAVQAELFCKSCYRKTCSHHACMTLVSPDRVFAELLRLSGEVSEATATGDDFIRTY